MGLPVFATAWPPSAAGGRLWMKRKMKKKRPPCHEDQGRLMVARLHGHEDQEQPMMKRLPSHENQGRL
jgi:hypothetical protein